MRLVLLFTLLICAACGTLRGGEVLFQEDFDSGKKSAFTQSLLKSKYVKLQKGKGHERSAAIRVTYKPNGKGTYRVTRPAKLARAVEEATLFFKVKFDRDFRFAKGGKLHGLGPAAPVTGGKPRTKDGWSARMMWHSKGTISTYLYDQADDITYGVGDRSRRPVFEKDEWHEVAFQLRINKSGSSNGFARVYVDGRRVTDTRRMEFRGSSSKKTLIQQFLFSTFHGGNSDSWTPKDDRGRAVTVYTLFDDILVKEGLHSRR